MACLALRSCHWMSTFVCTWVVLKNQSQLKQQMSNAGYPSIIILVKINLWNLLLVFHWLDSNSVHIPQSWILLELADKDIILGVSSWTCVEAHLLLQWWAIIIWRWQVWILACPLQLLIFMFSVPSNITFIPLLLWILLNRCEFISKLFTKCISHANFG